MSEANRELLMERMASRCGVDLDQQILVGLINPDDLSVATQECYFCSKWRDCQTLLNSGIPLVNVPPYCANSAFFKKIEQLAFSFWCEIELDASDDSAVISSELHEEHLSGVETYVELEGESLWVESWVRLEKQSRSWEWHYKCENWLLENAEPNDQTAIAAQTSASQVKAGHTLGSIVQNAEFCFWLALSVAKAMGLNLKAAVETATLTQTQYANVVLKCCSCPLHEQCQTWLTETKVPADTAPPGCANAAAFERLSTIGPMLSR